MTKPRPSQSKTLLSAAQYDKFARFLEARLGITLGVNKQYLVSSRLSKVMRDFSYEDINIFIDQVVSQQNPNVSTGALEAMTTNETFWFRDEYPYQILAKHLLPNLASQKNKLRIWSSACSFGQEPYSIAMVIAEFQRQYPTAFANGVEIVASDVSQQVLDFAKQGEYDELAINRGLPTQMLQRYFESGVSNKACISAAIRSRVTFKKLNLLDSIAHLGSFDIVFCRNVLIYFEAERKANILQKISALLHNEGALLLGASESINGAEQHLRLKKCEQGLYYSKA
ncbi:CheR family methyltransferase [Ningiella sp. W23]|uniref:CheR family methyltransferase n=1 Tax=Ningiella sp. W23 TaxID=3023715 RepID=UPI0037567C50